MQHNSNDDLLTLADAAPLMGVKPESIRARVCREGTYHGAQIFKGLNRRCFISRTDVEKIRRGERIDPATREAA